MKHLNVFTGLIGGSLVALLVLTAFMLTFVEGVEFGAIETAKMYNRPQPQTLTDEQVRQATWDAMFPCEGKVRYWDVSFDDYPTKEQCDEAIEQRRKQDATMKRARLIDEMATCVWETDPHYFEDETNHIDTVKHPRYHYSWVLGGDCEQMAHKVKSEFGLCKGFVDDDATTAEHCRQEVYAFLLVYCARADLPDPERRECQMSPLHNVWE